MRRVVAPLLCALAGGGCGSAAVSELPPPAEPARSPPLDARPAGRLVAVGREPGAVAYDPLTDLVAVGVREPASLVLVRGADARVRRRVALAAAPEHLALADQGGPVLVPAPRAGALQEVALLGRRVTTPRLGGRPPAAVPA
ncbi:MAG: YncE family protein, partial [Actinomycetota bacterium]|nr:YncE family protein [Actinomycetota bacterium]